MNEITKVEQHQISPYRHYADEHLASAIAGDLLRFVKGEFQRGPDKQPVDVNLLLLCNMKEVWTGWVRYFGGQVVETLIGRLIDFHEPQRREELGHLDKNLWETDASGTPLDPWSPTDRMIMREMGSLKLLTFSTSSAGGRKALARLCQEFDNAYEKHDGLWPVVLLDSYTYDHPNYGPIWNPRFTIADWAPWEGGTGNGNAAEPGAIEAPSTADFVDDETPF